MKARARRTAFWANPDQRDLVEQIVRDNPRRAGEPLRDYLHRIAVLCGLMSDDGPAL